MMRLGYRRSAGPPRAVNVAREVLAEAFAARVPLPYPAEDYQAIADQLRAAIDRPSKMGPGFASIGWSKLQLVLSALEACADSQREGG